MPLTVVARRDVCLMMLQDWDYEAHISNTAKASGKGMNLKQKVEQWNKADAEFVNSCINAMCNGNMEQEAMFDLHPEKFLVPSKKAQHKVPATFSKTNPTQKRKPTKRKLHQDSENDTVDNNVIKEQKLGYNPPHLVFLFERVVVCSGCEIPFNRKDCREPDNMVFKYMMLRTRPNGRGRMVQNNYHSAGYFHARDLGCLQNLEELEEVEVEDCYLTNETLKKLKPGHIDLLKARKL